MQVTNQERDLVFKIADGDHQIFKSIYFLRNISEDAKDIRYIDLLSHLVKKRITGQKFKDYLVEKHQGSILNLMADIRAQIFNDYKKRKIYAKQGVNKWN